MANVQIGNKHFFIPEKDSPCDIWKTYFQQLLKAVGRENAKLIWLITWEENGSITCTTKPQFSTWLRKNDLDVSNSATRTLADISQIGQNFLGLGKRLTSVLSIGIPVALAGILVVILIILINTAKGADATTVASIASPTSKIGLLASGIQNKL